MAKMGRIVNSRAQFNASFSEIVGYKAGLALNETQLAELVDEGFHEIILGDPDEAVMIRSEEAEELISQLLYGVGRTPIRHRVNPGMEVLRKMRRQPNGIKLYNKFQKVLLAELGPQQEGSGPFDFEPVVERAKREIGDDGLLMALMYYDFFQVSFEQSVWNEVRRVNWEDVTELDELFRSESIDTAHGSYLDQRFIDYLERNFAKIDSINWRKFEGLTCEFFERAGYHVEISEGRNDGGIDARIWSDKQNSDGPPTLLVQCKRQKGKVEKAIVKALWADVVEERAESGLIVTTSALSPGAKKVCTARSYPVHEADRKTVQEWLSVMRTPTTGVFLGF
jgi:restriction system protein